MRACRVTTFQPRDRVHLKGHPHTPHTTGTVRAATAGWPILVRWDDNDAITEQVPDHLEPAGEPMSQEPLDLTALRAEVEQCFRTGMALLSVREVLTLLDRVEQLAEESERADRAAKVVHDQSAIIERLTARAEAAEAKVAAALGLADQWERGAMRWQDPLRVPKEVSLIRAALGAVTHDPDWDDSMPGEDASCSCGFNGTPKECWLSRTALDGEA
jgi:hypothetical protein